MLFDLLYELSSVCVQLPVQFREVAQLVSDERLNEAAWGAHVRSTEHTNLKREISHERRGLY